MSRTTTDAAVIRTMTGSMMRVGSGPGTAGGTGTAAKSRTEAGSAAETETETGTVTAAAGMTVLMTMTGTAGQARKRHAQVSLYPCLTTRKRLPCSIFDNSVDAFSSGMCGWRHSVMAKTVSPLWVRKCNPAEHAV